MLFVFLPFVQMLLDFGWKVVTLYPADTPISPQHLVKFRTLVPIPLNIGLTNVTIFECTDKSCTFALKVLRRKVLLLFTITIDDTSVLMKELIIRRLLHCPFTTNNFCTWYFVPWRVCLSFRILTIRDPQFSFWATLVSLSSSLNTIAVSQWSGQYRFPFAGVFWQPIGIKFDTFNFNLDTLSSINHQ